MHEGDASLIHTKKFTVGDKPTSAFLIVTGSVDIMTQTDLKVANLKDGETRKSRFC